jgi:alpha-amylase/alpha-mannosidase (GH57 family)
VSLTHHALVLNLHQPTGNLDHLMVHEPWEAKQILFALDRIPRTLWNYEDVGRVHLSLSGTLLESLRDPAFQERVYGTVDCGALIWHLQNERIIRVLGTGYYHPVLPLIPAADREEQLARWRGIGEHLFWRDNFSGFWPPEMGFSMDLIPLLRRMGYRYVLVDSEHVQAVTPMDWSQLRYRPHVARHRGAEIVVVVRDRELSDAQESGMEFSWFQREVVERTRWCDVEPLVVTATDGDNGGWFRNSSPGGSFWGEFYPVYMEQVRGGVSSLRPSFIDEYLDRYGAWGEVTVKTGAWNTGWHHGDGFSQWTGSRAQRDALERVALTSHAVHDSRWHAGECHVSNQDTWDALENAMWHLLRAETSCNLFWGEAWVPRCHADLDLAWEALNRARASL